MPSLPLNPLPLVSRWHHAALAAVLCLAAGASHALGMQVPYSAFTTAPDVDAIHVCGQWPGRGGPGQGAGSYRVVHATRYAQSFLYVQWLARDANGHVSEVHTEGIPALNNDHVDIVLSQMRCQATRDGMRFTARAQPGHGGAAFRITIDATYTPGVLQYRSTAKNSLAKH
jgi:hypothetical protein